MGILVEQVPSKIGQHERSCVHDSLNLAIQLVVLDLSKAVQEPQTEWRTQETLSHIFNRKKNYFKAGRASNHANSWGHQGSPDTRLKMIEEFHKRRGFLLLDKFLQMAPAFKLDFICIVLQAATDVVAIAMKPANLKAAVPLELQEQLWDDTITVAMDVVKHIDSLTDDDFKKMNTDHIEQVQRSLHKFFDQLVGVRRKETYQFYSFWRRLALKLIKAPPLPIKLFGWDMVSDLIEACAAHRPPPRQFQVIGAGCSFVNGTYEFHGEITPDGYSKVGSNISYVRVVPQDDPDGGAGKKLTLFRCTMRSQQKFWFLSEADEEQPGTDRDIDYYQHKTKEDEEDYPPPANWLTCRSSGSAGVDPPPTLQREGSLVPKGEERNTLEHNLARWAIENEIVEQVLGDTTIHREVVSRSAVLVRFLATMCTFDKILGLPSTEESFSLKSSHLVFAWKTCTRKADEAVSAQVYQILVSVLPLCPAEISIPLLKAVQGTLEETTEKPEVLSEVGEFCSALASGHLEDSKSGYLLPDEVVEEMLNLLWSILTHSEASALTAYEGLKQYVMYHLAPETKGRVHRDRFLLSCVNALSVNASTESSKLDEAQALRTVNLTHFILEVYPVKELKEVLRKPEYSLHDLLFKELVAYLRRRKAGVAMFRRRTSSASTQSIPLGSLSDNSQHLDSLSKRFGVLKFVFGVSGDNGALDTSTTLSFEMLHLLWKLMDQDCDREALMVFIADASRSSRVPYQGLISSSTHTAPGKNELVLSSVFTDSVSEKALFDLFCSPRFLYEKLGTGAYASFQKLVNYTGMDSKSPDAVKKVFDALWRIYLTVTNEEVASLAMKDILQLYVDEEKQRRLVGSTVADTMSTDENDESFGSRVLNFLKTSRERLKSGDSTAEIRCLRCLRLLSAAIGHSDDSSPFITTSTLNRLAELPPSSSLEEVLRVMPHGLRGKGCCVRIGIVIKRPQGQSSSNAQPRPPSTLKVSLDIHPLETMASIKTKVAASCRCHYSSVRPIQITGRSSKGALSVEGANLNLGTLPEDTVMDELGVVEGCEMVFVVADRPSSTTPTPRLFPRDMQPFYRGEQNDLSSLFFYSKSRFSEDLFDAILVLLDSLPTGDENTMTDSNSPEHLAEAHKLAWGLLLSMPTNTTLEKAVESCQLMSSGTNDEMEIDSNGTWSGLIDGTNFNRSVYVLLVIDSLLRPAKEALSVMDGPHQARRLDAMKFEADCFRAKFLSSGGFKAVVEFFSSSHHENANQSEARRGNAVSLRILKACLFGNAENDLEGSESPRLNEGDSIEWLGTISDLSGLLESLTSMVIDDKGVSSSTVLDVIRFLRLLFQNDGGVTNFSNLPNHVAERFLTTTLLWNEVNGSHSGSALLSASLHVRRTAKDLILGTRGLHENSFNWLVSAFKSLPIASDSSGEYFDVLEKLFVDQHESSNGKRPSEATRKDLCLILCKKIASSPRPTSEGDADDILTGTLCGSLRLLRGLVEYSDGIVLREGVDELCRILKTPKWSTYVETATSGTKSGFMSIVSNKFSGRNKADDEALVDLIGAVFDGLLSPSDDIDFAVCCDKESRRRGFDLLGAAARVCKDGAGYQAISFRTEQLVNRVAASLRHQWNKGKESEQFSRIAKSSSKYSGLRNQGCTCYMNSFLQQLFMMAPLRKSLCSAPIPLSLRTSTSLLGTNGHDLVGKSVSLQWENTVSYEAKVEKFDEASGMHTIRYTAVPVATVGNSTRHQIRPEDIEALPPNLPEEFVLSDGRPGKETGVFEVLPDNVEDGNTNGGTSPNSYDFKETEEQIASRHLLEEVQRTLIYLEEAKGRCYDPRALVEASSCLKLEFDVWQQNDASEFATKLLDRLEISLKKWAPEHFQHLDSTFGFKQTKQKICKQCGLKTNREEKLLNVDCQIRGKSDILEALDALTEEEIMEGSNKVFCDRCKENTDTVLRTAFSSLPNVLILSLKRFDLDFTTFETVKLNSRCAFGHELNLKEYTLEGMEEKENNAGESMSIDGNAADENYEYRLAGVLVHAGVAQGGHYYSFIRDRSPNSQGDWYRFDDEDVTPFDPKGIEQECFGGKVKKETKWPNGQVHTMEQEQFANALMLFYEKVKPSEFPFSGTDSSNSDMRGVQCTSGYEAYEPDVQKSNNAHRWQGFLFDNEYQTFMQGLLGMYKVQLAKQEKPCCIRPDFIQTIYTYFFDVMMHSSDRGSLSEWTLMLQEIMKADTSAACLLTRDLASRTSSPSLNWMRHFLLECPDKDSRDAAVKIFSASCVGALSSDVEVNLLESWTKEMTEEVKTVEKDNIASGKIQPYPTGPNPNIRVGSTAALGHEASSLGIILSELNIILEALPRQHRFRTEIGTLVRDLSSVPSAGTFVLRKAMVEALIPCRLIALLGRGQLHAVYRFGFPGASIPEDVAETQVRPETHPLPTVHMSLNPHQLTPGDGSGSRQLGHEDYQVLFEALASLSGLPGTTHCPLLVAASESVGSRLELSDAAENAFAIIFREHCPPGSHGMRDRELENYIERCAIGSNGMPSQHVIEIMSKFASNTAPPGHRILDSDGFLKYYCDLAQTNEYRVRLDLHIFGFRPDLTRRSRESRIALVGQREILRRPPESVAVDVSEWFSNRSPSLGKIGELGLQNGFSIFLLAHSFSDSLTHYLVAAASYRKDSTVMIRSALRTIFAAHSDWQGAERVENITSILAVLASIPDGMQTERINQIMMDKEIPNRDLNYGCGLLEVTKAFADQLPNSRRPAGDFRWVVERYTGIIRQLRNLTAVSAWLNNNQEAWKSLERDLQSHSSHAPDHPTIMHSSHHRNTQNSHSDSDAMGTQDSDDDSHLFRDLTGFHGPDEIIITGAGLDAVNGAYFSEGIANDARMYVKQGGVWKGEHRRFTLFHCSVSNGTKHWYISIIPDGQQPGTTSDIDFYSAPSNNGSEPPASGWTKGPEGRLPVPRLEFVNTESRQTEIVYDDDDPTRPVV